MTVMTKPAAGLVLDVAALRNALREPANITEKRNAIPVLATALVRVSRGRVTVACTDMDTSITETLYAEDAPDGLSFCVDARRLTGLLSALEDEPSIALAVADHRLMFVAGDTAGHLAAVDPDDFPVDYTDFGSSEASLLDIRASELRGILADAAVSMSDEETRYYLNGVYLHTTEKVVAGETLRFLRAVATDGHQLTMSDTPLAGGFGLSGGVIVPRKTVGALLRVLAGRGEANVEVSVLAAKNRIRFRVGETEILSKLIDGTFPDYARVVPTEFSRSIQVNRVALLKAMRRVAVISTERSKAVHFSVDGTKLTLAAKDVEGGEARTGIAAVSKGGFVEWGANSSYMRSLLASSTAETVTLLLNDAASPIVLQGDGELGLRQVLMPMRI